MKPVKPETLSPAAPAAVSPTVVGSTLQYSATPQVDPEGQSAKRTFSAPVDIGPGAAGVVNKLGTIAGKFEYDVNVGELANVAKSSCAGCRHFSREAFLKLVSEWTGPASTAAQRQTIDGYRAKIKADNLGYVGETVEQTLYSSFGICHVLSEWVKGAVGEHPGYWPVTPMRDATCPTYVSAGAARMDVVTAAQPLGLFKPRDLDSKKIGAARYDNVLFDAAGKLR